MCLLYCIPPKYNLEEMRTGLAYRMIEEHKLYDTVKKLTPSILLRENKKKKKIRKTKAITKFCPMSAVGDIGQIITSFAYEPADVGVLQGYVPVNCKTI